MALMHEFLITGQLDKVHLGLRPEQVSALLGNPDDQSVRRRPVLLLRYGAVELVFKPEPDTSASRLVAISIHYDRPGWTIPDALRPDDWQPSGTTNESEFREFLARWNIAVHSKVQDEQTHLVLKSGTSAVFEEGKLQSIHFKRGEPMLERKQMTVSLPQETVEMLRQRARDEHMSISDLIERMISAGT